VASRLGIVSIGTAAINSAALGAAFKLVTAVSLAVLSAAARAAVVNSQVRPVNAVVQAHPVAEQVPLPLQAPSQPQGAYGPGLLPHFGTGDTLAASQAQAGISLQEASSLISIHFGALHFFAVRSHIHFLNLPLALALPRQSLGFILFEQSYGTH
jgi:hypothetical protein